MGIISCGYLSRSAYANASRGTRVRVPTYSSSNNNTIDFMRFAGPVVLPRVTLDERSLGTIVSEYKKNV